MAPYHRISLSIVLAAAGLAYAACTGRPSGNESRELCFLEEVAGNYLFEKKTACGCEQKECAENTMCFHHDCCNPDVEGRHPATCGCAETCEAGALCVAYGDARGTACCDPERADDRDFCGCTSACTDVEGCEPGADGVFGCACNPVLAQFFNENCGCTGEICDGADDCMEGECRCNPTNDAAKNNPNDCGCNGPCPTGAFCKGGACACDGENNIICCIGEDGEDCERVCIPQGECLCEPAKHQNDAANCGCAGPCAAGDRCAAGACACDPLTNSVNNANCGCDGSCPEGLECQGGACVCPAWKLSDPNDCACAGPCPDGVQCVGGVCGSCPEAKLGDPTDCGCKGPCPAGHACDAGTCQCPQWKLKDESDCGCDGPCMPGEQCVGGVCGCPPEKATDASDCGCDGPCDAGLTCTQGVCQCSQEKLVDPDDCGCKGPCPGVEAGPPLICSDGLCRCPPDFTYCEAAGDLNDTLPKNATACVQTALNYCSNCHDICPAGVPCVPNDQDKDGLVESFNCGM